ncbi:MAG: hypothetical protein AAF927_14680 [Bacteroidota bacterium]
MKQLSLLLLTVVFFSYCYSQNDPIEKTQAGRTNTESLTSGENMYGSVRTFDRRYQGVEGSPYFSNLFSKGTIWMKNGGIKKDVAAVLNLSESQIEVSMNGVINTIPFKLIDHFELLDSMGINRQFEVRSIVTEKGESEILALEKIYRGKSILYKQYYKEFRAATYQGAYSSDQRKDQYIDRSRYYVQAAGSPVFTSVRLSRSSWTKALETQKNEIKTFLKKEGLKMEQEQDAIAILRYYDSLFQ